MASLPSASAHQFRQQPVDVRRRSRWTGCRWRGRRSSRYRPRRSQRRFLPVAWSIVANGRRLQGIRQASALAPMAVVSVGNSRRSHSPPPRATVSSHRGRAIRCRWRWPRCPPRVRRPRQEPALDPAADRDRLGAGGAGTVRRVVAPADGDGVGCASRWPRTRGVPSLSRRLACDLDCRPCRCRRSRCQADPTGFRAICQCPVALHEHIRGPESPIWYRCKADACRVCRALRCRGSAPG